MTETVDPFEAHIKATPPGENVSFILCSLPLIDRYVTRPTWRRIVEGANTPEEFSQHLEYLHQFRSSGFLVPAYSAAIETYADGQEQYTLYVGHVDGAHFDDLDMADETILSDYRSLGESLIDYFEHCRKTSSYYLSDIARVDQYLYGRTPQMNTLKPILVDLELHASKISTANQLKMFYYDFILPLERKSGTVEVGLRERLQTELSVLDGHASASHDQRSIRNLLSILSA